MDTQWGRLRATGIPGVLGLDPGFADMRRLRSGNAGRFTILAEVTEPLAVCRLLLKMGLEVVAADSVTDVAHPQFDAARTFARAPRTGSEWWFLLYMDHSALCATFRRGLSVQEWLRSVRLEVSDIGGAEIFHLQFLDMDLIVPLEERIKPALDSLPEPEYRLIRAKC
jgi:hypothetical protein